MNISAAVVPKPNPGCEESESAVITTGPMTEVLLIIEESKAYAVRK